MASVPAPVFVTEGVTPVAAARPFEKTTSPSAYTAKSASPMETGRLKVCMLADSFVTSVLILSESEAPAGEMVCAEIPSSKRAETSSRCRSSRLKSDTVISNSLLLSADQLFNSFTV